MIVGCWIREEWIERSYSIGELTLLRLLSLRTCSHDIVKNMLPLLQIRSLK